MVSNLRPAMNELEHSECLVLLFAFIHLINSFHHYVWISMRYRCHQLLEACIMMNMTAPRLLLACLTLSPVIWYMCGVVHPSFQLNEIDAWPR